MHLEISIDGRHAGDATNLLCSLRSNCWAIKGGLRTVGHGDLVALWGYTKEVLAALVVVCNRDGTKEFEHNDVVPVVVERWLAIAIRVFEQPRGQSRRQLHLEVALVIEEEQLTTDKHELPNVHELGSRSTEAGEETLSHN